MERTPTLALLILTLLCTLLAPAGARSETGTAPLGKNTITRQFDHVVVKGGVLKENLGRRIPLMRLYAFKDGAMQPVPFQIDEITEEGDWVLPHRSPYLNKKDAAKAEILQEDPPEIMDENDELAFMVTDIGDRAAPSSWPRGWVSADEITLTDPLTDEKAWVYLFSFPVPKELSPVDYVEYRLPKETKQDRIYTDHFTLGFSHEVPITQDYLAYNDDDNILDRMKMRLFFRFFKFIKFSRNENDMQSRVWQYKDGPVRAVRMVRSSVRLIRNLQSPEMNSETLYYRNAVLMPIRIKMFNAGGGVLNEAFVDSGGDFRDRYGWKVRLNSDERWLNVDGKMDEVEKSVTTDGARWFILKGPKSAMIIFAHFLEDYGLETKFHYVDDDKNQFPPEFHPGQVPYIGFHIFGLERVQGFATFHLNIICFYLNKDYTEQELLRAMNIFDNPIQVEARGGKTMLSRAGE